MQKKSSHQVLVWNFLDPVPGAVECVLLNNFKKSKSYSLRPEKMELYKKAGTGKFVR